MSYSSIRDNHSHGSVGDFLKTNITDTSSLSIVSAYFTIYAFHHLKDELISIDNLRFLFGEPTFLKSLDPDKVNTRDFKIEDDQLVIPTRAALPKKQLPKSVQNGLQAKLKFAPW